MVNTCAGAAMISLRQVQPLTPPSTGSGGVVHAAEAIPVPWQQCRQPAHVIADLEYSRHDASASPAPERNVNSAAPQAAFVRGTLTAGWERILEVHQVENGPANGERQYGRCRS